MNTSKSLDSLIMTFIMQYDQRVKIGNKRNVEATERFKAAIVEAVEGIIGEDEVQPPWTFKAGDSYVGETVKIKHRNQLRKQQRKAIKEWQ